MKFITTLFTALFLSTAALAQSNCITDYPSLLAHLYTKYGEIPIATATIPSENAVLVIFLDEKDGSMTAVYTYPSGKTCIVAEGESFVYMDSKPGVDG